MATEPSAKIRLGLIAALVIVTGGWMAFDGAHALVTGDYVTPRSGDYAGQLGPWAALPSALGIDPRGVGVRVLFLVFGLSYLTALGAFLRRVVGSLAALSFLAALALLHLPFGTVASTIVLALLASLRRSATFVTHG